MAIGRFLRRRSEPGVFHPRTPEDISVKAREDAPVVLRALRLTHAGMVWEQGARAFWPLAALLAVVFAAFWLGLVVMVPAPALPWLMGGAVLVLIAAAVWGGLRCGRVGAAAAVARVDATLPGRPLSALRDHAALGGEGALWQAHQAQMRRRAEGARAVAPDAGLNRRDPLALRLAALVTLVMALIFGGAGNLGQGLSAVAATFRAPAAGGPGIATGPSWEGWAEPPAYTRRPTIYLNALPEGELLELPKGSAVSFRLYGGEVAVTQDIGPDKGNEAQAPAFEAMQSGVIEVAGRRFDVTVLPDSAPRIRPGEVPTRRADGRLVQDFTADDDHGVVAGSAGIALDLALVERRFGLAVDPEPREAIALDLPMPNGARQQVRGQLVQDLARHPWANLPVTLQLSVSDGIDQQGQSQPMQTILPGRRFFDPLAAALIEMRRDLLWSRENAGRSAEILRAVTWQPDGFVEQPLYLQLRAGVGVLEAAPLTPEARDKLAEALWQAAIQLEDGGLADALEAMKQAQEKLSEAIRNGASPDEIQRLMDELKAATDAYTQMLAEQGQPDPADRFTQNQPSQMITGDMIQQMMDEIQRLMNEGRMAEAQQLLEQFNRMMENLQVTQGQSGGQGQQGQGQQGNQSMNRLAEALREQQRLSDEAFREMQEQFGQGGPQGSGELAERQGQLREELGQQQGLMPGQGSEQGDAARQSLDQAGRAMDEAEQALRDGDMAGALDRQADAIQSMRDGMRALGDMLGQGQRGAEGQQQPGQDGQQPGGPAGQALREGESGLPYDRRAERDPLGRQLSGNGNVITDGDPLAEGVDPARRARDLLDEIRRRSGERTRPEDERDYLGRLLERF